MTATSTPALSIPQRDLRNRSGEMLRRAQAGETIIITTRGEQVAMLTPLAPGATGSSRGRTPVRPARRRGGWEELPLVVRPVSSQAILDEMRGER
ncbi:MAG: type II toxin-antitoxin system prevent-host-death family antitoxin [Micrococcales bacterium]|nr:type II toxin-antitoxin system prevent-host-death family antitoxin [Micrococcales bacterium]